MNEIANGKLKIKVLLLLFLLFISALIGAAFSGFLIFSIEGRIEELLTLAVISNLAADKRHLALFLVLLGLCFLLLCYVCFWKRSVRPAKVGMARLTPDIEIPVSSGQGQYGTARFTTTAEQDRCFAAVTITNKDQSIRAMLREGEKDQRAIREGAVRGADPLPGLSLPILDKGGVPVSYQRTGEHQELVKLICGDSHTLCFGSTRSGKTRTLVLQSLCLQALAGMDFCCSDPKGELYQYTFPFMRRLGVVDFAIDFKNPRRSLHYNFLQFVIDALGEDDVPKAGQACWDFVDSMVQEGSKSEPLWTNGEKGILAAAIMQVVYENSELGLASQYPNATPEAIHELYTTKHRHYQNCINLYHYISKLAGPNPETGNLLIEDVISTLPDHHPSKLTLAIAESAPAKTRGSFITSALTTLRLFTDPNIADLTSSTDCRLFDPSIRKAIYIILPDDRQTYYPLASMLVNQFYQYLAAQADERGGRLERCFEFNLDEFGNFTKIPFFDGKMTVAAGRGIHFHLYLQSKEQLAAKYDKETAGIILDNCHYWIYLKSGGQETLKLLEDKLGKYTVMSTSASASMNDDGALSTKNNGSTSASTQLIARSLLTANEIERIKRPYLLVLTGGYPSLLQIPDLHKWQFNTMLGLGDEAHNIRLRELREKARAVHKIAPYRLWDFQRYFSRLVSERMEQMGTGSKDGAGADILLQIQDKLADLSASF